MESIPSWCLLLSSLCVSSFSVADFQDTETTTVSVVKSITDKVDEDINVTFSTNPQGNLPSSWNEFCTLEGREFFKNKTTHQYNCYINETSSEKWKFIELRTYISPIDAYYTFKVQCENGAKISLPNPGKSKNIVKLHVYGCKTVDYYADYKNTELDSFPDVMEEYVLINVTAEIGHKAIIEHETQKSNTLPDNVVCGDEETMKISILRNFTYDIINDYPIDFNQFGELATIMIRKDRLLTHKCVFEKQEILEETYVMRNRYFANELTEQKLYPVLKTLNVSHSDIYYIPEQFKNWWIYFEALEYVDMSYNRIQDVLFPISIGGMWGKPIPYLTYDLTYNDVSQISVRLFERLIANDKIFVKIENNPFNCTCTNEMKEVLKFIKETDWNSAKYKRYQYFRDLQCHLPKSVKGRRLRDLNTNDINCGFELMPLTVALSVFSLLLLILLIVMLKYRREIRILFFTRFNVVLPCQPVELYEDKEFDAFVSYSNDDQDWVLDVFDDDKNERLAHLKFCMHQKDFVPGKTIFENIVKCVENSKHTVIVLSQHFLNSNFCMWEFQEAFQQSIVERKRHLIIILLEEIPEKEIPNDLKRCMKTFTYIRKDDNIFIDRLLYSLSYKGRKGKEMAPKVKVAQINLGFIDPKDNDLTRKECV